MFSISYSGASTVSFLLDHLSSSRSATFGRVAGLRFATTVIAQTHPCEPLSFAKILHGSSQKSVAPITVQLTR
jgi:hypothetical protein